MAEDDDDDVRPLAGSGRGALWAMAALVALTLAGGYYLPKWAVATLGRYERSLAGPPGPPPRPLEARLDAVEADIRAIRDVVVGARR